MGDVIRFPRPQQQQIIPETKKRAAPRPREPKPAYRASTTCWACGTHRSEPGRDYCTPCSLAGLDTPLVPCSVDECNTVRKRRHRGEQSFTCAGHGRGTA